MKSWRISGGDLVLGPGGFETVTGAPRLIQALRHALAEPMGIDRFHKGWGSLVDEFVGQPINDATAFDLEQEVNRVIGNYMAVQNEKVAKDMVRDTPSRYSTSDVIAQVSNVKIEYRQDKASILITVVTLSGDEVSTMVEVEN